MQCIDMLKKLASYGTVTKKEKTSRINNSNWYSSEDTIRMMVRGVSATGDGVYGGRIWILGRFTPGVKVWGSYGWWEWRIDRGRWCDKRGKRWVRDI